MSCFRAKPMKGWLYRSTRCDISGLDPADQCIAVHRSCVHQLATTVSRCRLRRLSPKRLINGGGT